MSYIVLREPDKTTLSQNLKEEGPRPIDSITKLGEELPLLCLF